MFLNSGYYIFRNHRKQVPIKYKIQNRTAEEIGLAHFLQVQVRAFQIKDIAM